MRTVISKDGTPIAFERSGQGPALILVAAASGTRRDQAPLAAALAPFFTVFAYDRRGRGDSGDTLPYAVEREIEDIEALINEAGGSAFAFGHSSGAALILDAGGQLPEKIMKLALYEPPFIVDDSRQPVAADFAQHLADLIATGQRGSAVEYFMTSVGMPAEGIAQMRQSPTWPELEKTAPTLVYDAIILGNTQSGDPSALDKWASVEAPTLVMDGTTFLGSEARHTFMRHGAQKLVSILPNAQHRILEGQDHGPANEVLVPALKAFFLGG